jgi:ComF family protein
LIHQLSALIYSGLWAALDWVFPPECAACGEPGYRLCLKCQGHILFTDDWLEIGSAPGARSHSRRQRQDVPEHCAGSLHLAYYEGVIRECIHSIKYQENRGLGEFFSKQLMVLVLNANWGINLVIPVPLSSTRLKERGYNQSALIARPLAARLRVPCNAYGLERILDTPSQVGLSAEERRKNVAGAFIARSEIVRAKSILLVDDVMTTGSTLSACAGAAMRAGSQAVYAVTLGRHFDRLQASTIRFHQV